MDDLDPDLRFLIGRVLVTVAQLGAWAQQHGDDDDLNDDINELCAKFFRDMNRLTGQTPVLEEIREQ